MVVEQTGITTYVTCETHTTISWLFSSFCCFFSFYLFVPWLMSLSHTISFLMCYWHILNKPANRGLSDTPRVIAITFKNSVVIDQSQPSVRAEAHLPAPLDTRAREGLGEEGRRREGPFRAGHKLMNECRKTLWVAATYIVEHFFFFPLRPYQPVSANPHLIMGHSSWIVGQNPQYRGLATPLELAS